MDSNRDYLSLRSKKRSPKIIPEQGTLKLPKSESMNTAGNTVIRCQHIEKIDSHRSEQRRGRTNAREERNTLEAVGKRSLEMEDVETSHARKRKKTSRCRVAKKNKKLARGKQPKNDTGSAVKVSSAPIRSTNDPDGDGLACSNQCEMNDRPAAVVGLSTPDEEYWKTYDEIEQLKKSKGREFYREEGVFLGTYRSDPREDKPIQDLLDEVTKAGSQEEVKAIMEHWAEHRSDVLEDFNSSPSSQIVSIYRKCSLVQVWGWQDLCKKALKLVQGD